MFQIDEKIIADNRTMLTIQSTKSAINSIIKNGTINYTKDDSNLWLTNPKVRQAYINKDPKILDMYDRIIMARNGSNIDGSFVFDDNQKFSKDLEVGNNLLVRGNLTVTGDSTTIDTPRLTVEDNIIELNRNEKNDGITLVNSGMAFNRGTKAFARYLYNELEKAFVLDTSSNIDGDITTDSWILKAHSENSGSNIIGEVRVKSKLTVPIGNITGTLSVAQSTTTDTLLVNSTSVHTGASTFSSTVGITDSLTVNGKTHLNNTLNVKSSANFESDVTMKQNLIVDKVGTFKERSVFQKGLVVNSLGADITGLVNIVGNTSMTGTLSTSDNVNFSKDLTVGETTNTKNLNITLTTNTKDLNVSNNATITKNLVVNGTTTLNNNTIINATKTTINSIVEITGDTQITNKNLVTTSTSDTTGNVTVGGSLAVNKNMTVNGDSTITGNVNNNGDLIANNLTSRNNITVHAGNGKGIRFNNEDTYKVYVSDQADSTWGRAISSNSDGFKNMYFSMPTNKTGFVFKSNSIALAEINALGQIHSIEHMFAKNSQVLRHADMGHAPTNNTAINACMLDGKHYSDLVDQFIDVNGDAMNGKLTMNNEITMVAQNRISFNGLENSYIRAGGAARSDVVIGSSNNVYFYPGGSTDVAKLMLLQSDGNLSVKGSNVLRVADEGHENGIDADTVDGKHLTDLDNRYINVDGDTMNGQLNMNAAIKLTGASGAILGNGNKLILQDHYNGNVSISATGEDLYIGYSEDTKRIMLQKDLIANGKTVITSNGTIPYSVLSGIPKFVSNIGNGSATSFTIPHGLEIADLVITVKEVLTNEIVYPDVKCDATNIVITFTIAPTLNQYRIIAIG